MSFFKSWWSLWTTGRDTKEEIAKATKAVIDKEPIKAQDLWAWAQTDPASAAQYMCGMNRAAGVDAHVKLTMRLIAELTSKNVHSPRKPTSRPQSTKDSKRPRCADSRTKRGKH